MNMKKKILFAVCLVIFLTCLGMGVYFFKKYYNTDEGKTKIYQRELKDNLNLQGNKSVIKILKDDMNQDGIEDYIALLGEEKYEDKDTTKNTDIKKILSNVEMYNNICVDFIDGKEKKSIRYETKKSYGNDVQLRLVQNKEEKYIVVNDCTTGKIAMLYLSEGKLKNAISKSFSKEFCGYTIEANFKKDDETKLQIKLDNFGRDYLPKKEEVISLDYADTNVNKENYRVTYMANKFCDFEFINLEDGTLEVVGIQNILYSNKEELEKTTGKVLCKFKFNDEKKLVIDHVEVIK